MLQADNEAGMENRFEETIEPEPTQGLTDRPTVYTSAELLQGRREAWIEHGEQMYRLRLTHAGKLYLTK